MAVVEALAAGIPVISTDQAMSAHDFIRSGESGWMVPAENANEIANLMKELLANPQLLVQMSPKARLSIQNYDPENGAKALVQFAKDLLP
jgi:glycosyltransferase involved in cell wall biosynthesis